MSALKLVALSPRTEALGSKDARSAGDHSAQLSDRDGLTARERDVISQTLSDSRVQDSDSRHFPTINGRSAHVACRFIGQPRSAGMPGFADRLSGGSANKLCKAR
jgi:hypothetical protein